MLNFHCLYVSYFFIRSWTIYWEEAGRAGGRNEEYGVEAYGTCSPLYSHVSLVAETTRPRPVLYDCRSHSRKDNSPRGWKKIYFDSHDCYTLQFELRCIFWGEKGHATRVKCSVNICRFPICCSVRWTESLNYSVGLERWVGCSWRRRERWRIGRAGTRSEACRGKRKNGWIGGVIRELF